MFRTKTTLTFLSVFILISASFQQLFPIKEYSKIPSDILMEFPDYQLLFHYDDITSYDILPFFTNKYCSSTLLLLNYSYRNDTSIFLRPVGYKYLHVVYLQDPFSFEEFSDFEFNLEYNDIVIFLMRVDVKLSYINNNVRVVNVWNQKGLDKCGCIFVYNMELEKFYYVHYYVGKLSGVLKEVNATLINSGDIPKLTNYLNHFRNFKGHVFEVAYFPYHPFIWCTDRINPKTGKKECSVQGIDGNIVLLLSRYLNFKFVMRKAEFKPGGALWKTMIEDVHFERRDWAVGGISTSLERLQLADFTSMLHMESYTAFFTVPEKKVEDWHGILKPFQSVSWLAFALLLISVGFILNLARKIKFNRFSYIGTVSTLQFGPFRAIVDQTIPGLHVQLFTVRFILSVWILASIILTTAYKSKLASTMIRPKIWEPSTVLDLYEHGYTFQVNAEDWTVLKESLANSMDSRYTDLLERCYDNLQFCSAVEKTLHNKVAVFDEETAMPFIIFNICKDLFGPNDIARFRLLKQQLFPSVHAWPLRLGAPYRYRFSYTFQILISAGIVEHWYSSLIGRSIARSNSYRVDLSIASALSTKSFTAPAVVLVLGLLAGTITFIYEHIHKWYFTRNKHKL